jgi:hypothetical protein
MSEHRGAGQQGNVKVKAANSSLFIGLEAKIEAIQPGATWQ